MVGLMNNYRWQKSIHRCKRWQNESRREREKERERARVGVHKKPETSADSMDERKDVFISRLALASNSNMVRPAKSARGPARVQTS
jgi:hypothetical protein